MCCVLICVQVPQVIQVLMDQITQKETEDLLEPQEMEESGGLQVTFVLMLYTLFCFKEIHTLNLTD